ncbi:hypothetical protein B0H14DRAFT_3589234 [Mycena olivaceomarginata]|nr:hypothetical protein B0H14DRAFT_3589234 [Mycena olivaceomarginata]
MRTGNLCLLAMAGVLVTASVVPHPGRALTKTLPTGWSYIGCKVDVGNRILVAASQGVDYEYAPNVYIILLEQRLHHGWRGIQWVSLSLRVGCQECCRRRTQIALRPAPETPLKPAAGRAAFRSIRILAAQCLQPQQGGAVLLGPASEKFVAYLIMQNSEMCNGKAITSIPLSSSQNWHHSNTPKNNVFPFYAMQWNAAGITTLEADARAAGRDDDPCFQRARYRVAGEHDARVRCQLCVSFGELSISLMKVTPAYKQYIHPLSAKGFKLATPAVTNGGAPRASRGSTLSSRRARAARTITSQCTGTAGGSTTLTEFIEGAKKYGKPIYLTEFGLAWDADAQASNYEGISSPLALSYLDGEPAVAKYAFFGAFNSGTGKDMIAANDVYFVTRAYDYGLFRMVVRRKLGINLNVLFVFSTT